MRSCRNVHCLYVCEREGARALLCVCVWAEAVIQYSNSNVCLFVCLDKYFVSLLFQKCIVINDLQFLSSFFLSFILYFFLRFAVYNLTRVVLLYGTVFKKMTYFYTIKAFSVSFCYWRLIISRPELKYSHGFVCNIIDITRNVIITAISHSKDIS